MAETTEPSDRSERAPAFAAGLLEHWYVACFSRELRSRPIAREVMGVPLVLFRSGGRPVAALDRCPHRNTPLSLGSVTEAGWLRCPYHGWQFDEQGACRLVPGLVEEKPVERSLSQRATREQDGLVWVHPGPGAPPSSPPHAVGLERRAGYQRVLRAVDVEATLYATLENALDVPHTAFVHRGLFRTGNAHRIHATVRRYARSVEAEYRGEPRPAGVVGRLLAPGGGTVEHWDRFFLPSVAQVEYRLENNHFLITALCTPLGEYRTRIFAVASFRTRALSRAVRWLLEPIALQIFRQDARILSRQTATIRRFGGERFMSTEIDVLGPHIRRLLHRAERGDLSADTVPQVSEVELFA